MLRRILLGLLALALAGVGLRLLVLALASDETRIRWRLEGAVAGFDDERSGPTLRLLAPDYADETTGADRDLVRAGMAQLFFQERDPRSKRFTLDLELVEERLVIAVADDTAEVTGLLRLHERRSDAPQPSLRWELEFEAELVKDPGEGWRVHRSRHETLAGERPR